MLTLQEFIRDSLTQILDGVAEARARNQNIGMQVLALGKQEASCTTADGSAGVLVNFDVAVSAVEKTGKEGSGGIAVMGAKIGGTASSDFEHSSVSRIQFSVPVVFSPDSQSHQSKEKPRLSGENRG